MARKKILYLDKKVPKNDVKTPPVIKETPSMEKIETFNVQGISFLETLDESTLNEMVKQTNDAYYNSNQPLLTDNLYDILVEYIKKKYPDNTVVKEVGAPITRNKVQLPYEMWSMDKIKPDTHVLEKWKKKFTGPYLLSCKLDGVSGLYDGKTQKLYTRGDGKIGQDISPLIPYLRLPATDYAVRGEFIIKKAVFDKKYKATFANPRNMVSGLINKQTYDERIHDLDFVVYEIVHPPMPPGEQLKQLTTLGFHVVQYQQIASDKLTNEELSAILVDWRTNYEYEIDGVIVADDHIHKRKTGNPEHAFAFKMVLSDQMAEAKVVDVVWQASKDGYLKPRIRIEPVHLGGVKIEYATGFNGKFIEDNKIGIGAIVKLIRSGDVIPHIQAVVVPAEIAKMPEQAYVWTDKHVDVVLADLETDPDVALKNVTAFFTTLGIEGLAKGNVKRLMDAGYNSVAKIVNASRADFEKAGFKSLADKFVRQIEDVLKKATLVDIMDASNKMGRGMSRKTLQLILEKEPHILQEVLTEKDKYEKLVKIKGIGEVNARTFVSHIPIFLAFLKECGLEDKLNATTAAALVTMNAQAANSKHSVGTKQESSHPLHQKKNSDDENQRQRHY